MNEPIQHDILRWSAAEEGPFFERKSALERSGGTRKPRKAAEIAHDIAETLAAFANADGGELVVGIEDDGTVSGVPHAEDKVRLLLGVWRSLKDWTASGWILSAGSSTGRGRYYVPGPRLLLQVETNQNGTEAATMPTEAATIIPDGPLHQSPTAPVTRETDAMGLETDAMKGKD
jgi:hypothetical protein